MGNKQLLAPPPQPDSLGKAQVEIAPGTIVAPIAENSEATVFSTQFRSPFISSSNGSREIHTVLAQNHGKYIVRPKNTLGNGKVLQVKSMNPQPDKLFYVVRKQDGADKWIFDNE